MTGAPENAQTNDASEHPQTGDATQRDNLPAKVTNNHAEPPEHIRALMKTDGEDYWTGELQGTVPLPAMTTMLADPDPKASLAAARTIAADTLSEQQADSRTIRSILTTATLGALLGFFGSIGAVAGWSKFDALSMDAFIGVTIALLVIALFGWKTVGNGKDERRLTAYVTACSYTESVLDND